MVNSTQYLPHDSLALALGCNKSKAFVGRAGLLAFARTCEVADAEQRPDRIEAAMVLTMETCGNLIDEAKGFRDALNAGLRRIERQGVRRSPPGDG